MTFDDGFKNMAVGATEARDWKEAVRLWEKVRENSADDVDGYVRAAFVLRQLGSLVEAEVLAQQAMACFPDCAEGFSQYAEVAMQRGDWKEAAERWAAMRKTFADRPVCYARAILALRQDGALVRAESLAQQGVAQLPENAWIFSQYAEVAMQREDWQEAVVRWEKVREKFSETSGGYIRAAFALRRMGNVEEAEKLAEQAIGRFPDNSGGFFEYAEAAMQREDWQKAVVRWETVRGKFSETPGGYIRAAFALRRMGNVEEAEKLAEQAIARFPDNSGGFFEYAEAAMQREDWQKAVVRWETVREKFSETPGGYIRAAFALRRMGNVEEAEKLAEQAIGRFPDNSGGFFEYAEAAMQREDWQKAVVRWETVREKFSETPGGYIRAAFALRRMGNVEEAEKLAEQAIGRFPDNSGGFFEYAEAAMQREDWQEAVVRWETARSKFPDHAICYARSAFLLRKVGKFTESETLIQEAVKSFPDDFNVLREYSELAMFRLNWDVAVKRWEVVLTKFPKEKAGFLRGCLALRRNEQFDEAEQLLQKALALFPNDPTLHEARCEISMERKHWKEACRRWEELRKFFPDYEPAYERGVVALREYGKNKEAEQLLVYAGHVFEASPWAIYDNVNLQITLRCNEKCKNCIELCNMKDVTGLDYRDTDMTLSQVRAFVENVKRLKHPHLKVVRSICVTGGEALLHSDVVQILTIIDKELVQTGLVGEVFINSNLSIKPPAELEKYIVNFSKPVDNPFIHNTALLHPHDFNKPSPTFTTCNHYRKWRVVLNCYGYSLCCAGDAYIRLFGLDELVLDHLPDCYSKFPIEKMDRVCQHCPFGTDAPPLQRDYGRPVSQCYAEQAELNRQGRKIVRKLPE